MIKSLKKSLAVLFCFLLLIGLTMPVLPFTAKASDTFDPSKIIRSRIAAGGAHGLAVHSDGTVWAWGDNSSGQLGTEGIEKSIVPIQVPGLTDIISVSAGGAHSLALKKDGTVWAWGENQKGQIGNGESENIIYAPYQVENLNNVIQVSAGFEFSIALKEDGTIYGWGSNESSQIGWHNGSQLLTSPAQVDYTRNNYDSIKITGLKKVSAGGNFVLALQNDGSNVEWGASFNDPDRHSSFPIPSVPATKRNDISAGFNHRLIVYTDGTVWGYGNNDILQLGDSNTTDNLTRQVIGLSNIKTVSAGFYHSTILDNNGKVFSLGVNGAGQLGDGSDPKQVLFAPKPVQVKNLDYVVEISSGIGFSIALKSNGTIWAWGTNDYGQLGNNTIGGPQANPDDGITGYSTPVLVGSILDSKLSYNRISGYDATNTSVEISKEGWKEGADTVVLATVANFPDALAGAPLARQFDAPILLTNSKQLNLEVSEEINRLNPSKIIIVGGTSVVSKDIQTLLEQKYQVERIAGWDQFDTAAEIAKYLIKVNPEIRGKAVIAYGRNFPDALSISSWAAYNKVPILLSESKILPQSTKDAIEALNLTETIIVGGTAVISQDIENQLPNVRRFFGNDQYDTSIAIANGLTGDAKTIFLATGANFPDALAGSALAAKTGSPIILVDRNLSHPTVQKYLLNNSMNVTNAYILGGSAVVSSAVVDKINNIFPY